MKKNLIIMLASLFVTVGTAAQTISVNGPLEALTKGETVTFNLHIEGAVEMTSAHFEVVLPTEFSVASVAPTASWNALFSHEGGVVGAISTSANAFTGEGDIAAVQVAVPAGTAVGCYPVTVCNVRVNGETLTTTAEFQINVVTAHTVVLDEAATALPATAEGVNVRVLRTISAAEWSTICLPFAMTGAQVQEAFGSGVQIATLSGWTAEEDDEGAIVGLKVVFEPVEAMEANHPYIIKVEQAVNEFTVEGVDVVPEEEPVVQVGRRASERGWMYGTYVVGTVPEEHLFLSAGKFWYSVGKTETLGLRGYFQFREVLDAYYDAAGAPSRITLLIGSASGIGNAAVQAASDEVYDLQGRRVAVPGRGLYITKNKKVKL